MDININYAIIWECDTVLEKYVRIMCLSTHFSWEYHADMIWWGCIEAYHDEYLQYGTPTQVNPILAQRRPGVQAGKSRICASCGWTLKH